MKKQIDRIVELAKQYVDFGISVGLPLNYHSALRDLPNRNAPSWGLNGDNVRVYFGSDYDTWSVYFGKIEITGFKKAIELPFALTVKDLNKVIADVTTYLNDHLIPNTADIKMQVSGLTDRLKAEKIERLKRELAELEK